MMKSQPTTTRGHHALLCLLLGASLGACGQNTQPSMSTAAHKTKNAVVGITASQIAKDRYAHIVAVKDGDTCSLYIDGALEKTFGCSMQQSATGPFSIGASTAAVRTCKEILAAKQDAVSGLYSIDPDGPSGNDPFSIYCDMTTDGGGWTLMAKFSMHQSIKNYPQTKYDAYFRLESWIEGNSDGPPQSPQPTYDDFHVESLDWGQFLESGGNYELRQTFFKDTGTQTFDVAYDFTYNGVLVQNNAVDSKRAWDLSNRAVFTDDTGVAWNTPSEQVRFWLPFTEGISGNIYTACGSYKFSPDGCSHTTASTRRFGNAGIIGAATDGNDPAGAWAPLMRGNVDGGLVYMHQATATYGNVTDPMTLLYWIR